MSDRCVRCGGITSPGLIAGMTSHPRGFSKCDCDGVQRNQNYSQRDQDRYVGGLSAGMRPMTPQERIKYRPVRRRSRESIYRDVYVGAGLVGILILGIIIVTVRAIFF